MNGDIGPPELGGKVIDSHLTAADVGPHEQLGDALEARILDQSRPPQRGNLHGNDTERQNVEESRSMSRISGGLISVRTNSVHGQKAKY